MAEISVQLHSCLTAMKTLSRQKRDAIIRHQEELLDLRKQYDALGTAIEEKDLTVSSLTQELEALNVHIKGTQQSYRKILDSTHELMKQVQEYNPTGDDKAGQAIEETLDELRRGHQEIQMTNFAVAKSRQAGELEMQHGSERGDAPKRFAHRRKRTAEARASGADKDAIKDAVADAFKNNDCSATETEHPASANNVVLAVEE